MTWGLTCCKYSSCDPSYIGGRLAGYGHRPPSSRTSHTEASAVNRAELSDGIGTFLQRH